MAHSNEVVAYSLLDNARRDAGDDSVDSTTAGTHAAAATITANIESSDCCSVEEDTPSLDRPVPLAHIVSVPDEDGSSHDMRFHVIGLGSIGTLFAHHLRRVVPVKHGVTLLKRTPLDARKAEETGGKISVEFGGITMPRDGFIYDSGPRVADPTLSLAGKQKRFMEYRESLLRRKRDGDYIESLIVSTKAGSTLEALKALRPRLDAHSTIVLLQNGMGVYEHLTREVFPQPSTRPHFILTANTHGAWLKNPGHVVHAGFGRVDFGIVPDPRRGRDFEALFHTYATHPERLNALVDGDNMGTYVGLRNTISALLALDLNVHWQPISDVETTMRRKLVTNAVINPLTAILRCNNGGLLSNENATRIRDAVCHEASAVFAAQLRAETQRKLSTPPQTPELESESAWANGQFDMVDQEDFDSGYDSDDVPSSFPPPLSDAFASQPWHSTLLPAALRPEALIKECQRITTITRNNVSSMLRDVRRGAPTEIDYINGYLLSLGAAYRIPMPVTSTLYRMVKLRSTLPETEPV